MADVVFYQALSLDGFVTDSAGSAAWQGPYFIPELGFHDFIAGVSAVIVAAATYDKIAAGGRWPYGALPGFVPTQTPLADIGAPVTPIAGGPTALVHAARAVGSGTIWVQGDTALALRLIEAGLIDRMELFVMPLALGAGSEYIGPQTLARFTAGASQTFSNGVVRTSYMRRA